MLFGCCDFKLYEMQFVSTYNIMMITTTRNRYLNQIYYFIKDQD